MLSRKDDGQTVVLGAGAAGLTAALELANNNQPVTVVDLETSPGGLCRTVEREGWRFDLGGHRFISRDESLVDSVKELLGSDLLEATRRSVILLNGKCFRYPLEPMDLVRNLSLSLGLRGFVDFLRQQVVNRQTHHEHESFRQWTIARYGRTFYNLFFGPYSEKLWGISPDQLSSDWAGQRISLIDLTDVVLRLLGLRRNSTRTYALRYFYPRNGIGQVFTAMADRVVAKGGKVHLSTRVVGFNSSRGRVAEVQLENDRSSFTLPCDQVISTIPLPDLALMLFPDSPDVQAAAAQLGFRGVRFLNILLDREDVSPNTWHYVADPRYLPTRIQEPKRRSPWSAPPGKTSLMLEIPCEVGGDVWGQSDETLLDRCLGDLNHLGIEVDSDVRGCFSTRITHGYPVFRLGYRSPRDRLLAAVDQISNVTTCGRQGTFRYIFMDTAMQMGIMAARKTVGSCTTSNNELQNLHDENSLLECKAITAG